MTAVFRELILQATTFHGKCLYSLTPSRFSVLMENVCLSVFTNYSHDMHLIAFKLLHYE